MKRKTERERERWRLTSQSAAIWMGRIKRNSFFFLNRRGERKEWGPLPHLKIVADGKGPKAKVLGGAKFTKGYHSSALLEFRLPACHSGRLTQKINFRPLKRGRFWIEFYEPEGWQRRQDGLQLYRIIIIISPFSISVEPSLSLSLSFLHAQCKFANSKFLFRAIEIVWD